MNVSLLLGSLAVVLSIVSIGVTSNLYRRQMAMSERHYLSSLWNGILDLSHSNPRYIDITVTENYRQAMTPEERVKYDIFCFKAWGHAQEIVEHGDPEGPQSLAALQWLIAFHLTWLEDNSAHFLSDTFWTFIEEKKVSSALVLRHRTMPTLPDGEIDWDAMSGAYFDYVLSPFHPEMLEQPQPRNTLVERIDEHVRGAARDVTVADFGCGIGSLLPHLSGISGIREIYGVEQSLASLNIAQRTAERIGLPFVPIHGDIKQTRLSEPVDVAVVVNSILPSERSEVHELLVAIAENLQPDGWLMGIFPSFDTTEYLLDLWRDEYRRASGSRVHGERVRETLSRAKMVDAVSLKYADDGVSQQCYHTEQSLRDELVAAGFSSQMHLEKVYYPWELTKKFDYGYFPGAAEEIWDWLVITRRA